MTASLSTALLIVSIVLFLLAAIPPVPHSGSLVALGLMFLAAAHLA